MEEFNVKCPNCNSTSLTKDGQKSGRQRYKCKKCGKKFTFGLYINTVDKTIKQDKKQSKIVNQTDKINKLKTAYRQKELYYLIINLFMKKEKIQKSDIMKLEEKLEIITIDELNKIVKKFSNEDLKRMQKNLLETLFEPNTEKVNELIINLFMINPQYGISKIMEIINVSQSKSMINNDYNILGKYMSKRIDISWQVISNYIYTSKTNNSIYTITRYMYYVAKLSCCELKKHFKIEELRKIYFDEKLYKVFSIKKLKDSEYYNNASEFFTSLNIILNKLSQAPLVNYNYLEQYKNSLFTGDANLEVLLKRASFCTKRKDNYDQLIKLSATDVSDIPWEYMPAYPILSKNGIEKIGKYLSKYYEEYKKMKFRCTQREYNIWLDGYTKFIYNTILEYGQENFKSFFTFDNCNFGCRIDSPETEEKALLIIKELKNNTSKKINSIEMEILGHLLYYISDEAIKIFIKRIESGMQISQQLSFYFILGISEKLFGSNYNLEDIYHYSRINAGNAWEKIVGCVLHENFNNIKKHYRLDNNKIPDYVMINNNEIEKIIECKLVLGFKEFEETVKKYSSYSNIIEFYCVKNAINEEVFNSKEYMDIMKTTTENFKYAIKDFKDVYKMTDAYEETFKYFEMNLKNATPENFLKEKISLIYEKKKRKKIIYLIDKTIKISGLF